MNEGAPSPTRQLVHEHAVIGLVIAAMEREAARVRETGDIEVAAVERMVRFTREFTDGCHHEKEERLLFPLMQEVDSGSVSPVSLMLREHDGARLRIAAVMDALPAARDGDPLARRTIAANLVGYASLLFSHIARENNLVFPLAERVLNADDKRRLVVEFGRVDEEAGPGAHEQFEAMARELAGMAE